MNPKFLVGNELVEAHVPEDEILPETTKLAINDGFDVWHAEAKQLKKSYTPVSEGAQLLYDTVIENYEW